MDLGFSPASRGILRPVSIFCAAMATMLVAAWVISWLAFGTIGGLDVRLLLAVRGVTIGNAAEGDPVRQLMICATALGAFPTLLLLVLFTSGLLASTGQRTAAFLLLLRSGGGVVAANLLKRVVDRPRPLIIEHWTTFSSSSFPSGHSADGTIVYLLLAAIAVERLPSSQNYLTGCAMALVMLIGTSRVFLGVHWPTDVIGGWLVGSAWVLACLSWRPGGVCRTFPNG